ncbi:MAG: hypothetical protein Q9226_001863 [Calogaya cf. arnoldii]
MSMDEEVEVTVGDVRYVLIPNQYNFIPAGSFKGDDPTPLLVYLTAPGDTISKPALCKFRADLDRDDVFQPSFCCNIVYYGSEEDDLQIEPDALEELAAWQTKTQTFVTGNSAVKLPSTLLVLSRPLDGARISVKDNIDIAGHKTTLCNRAWIDLYPAKTENAACVQVLLDAGAVIVCKVKLQAMIMREEPLECVEFTAPFNPRVDGYQVPSGSSHGSAAGIGSYDWLDFSIGSDTNGSGRKPASYNGCFSIRPSTGIMNTDGVIGQFPWVSSNFIPETPIKVLYPLDYLPTPNPAQTRLID